MKIRDLKQYPASICKEEQPRSITQEVADFAMLKTMFGAKKDAKGIIGTSSSFASNSQEQLFYEFVQNAFDANADTLLFNANKDFLVVLIMVHRSLPQREVLTMTARESCTHSCQRAIRRKAMTKIQLENTDRDRNCFIHLLRTWALAAVKKN